MPAVVSRVVRSPAGRSRADAGAGRARHVSTRPSSARSRTTRPSRLPRAGILRAEALLRQARSATRLQVNGNVTTTTLNRASSSTARP